MAGRKVHPPIEVGESRFGRLLVIGDADPAVSPNGERRRRWLCRCDCDTEKEFAESSLKSGNTKSCGCLKRETMSATLRTHGMTDSREYNAYYNMLARCYKSTNAYYADYGGRGITICDRWRFGENSKTGFECFVEDMGPSPSSKHTLERPDTNGNYGPDNGCWATPKLQARNRRSNIRVVLDGVEMCLLEACERKGTPYSRVQMRRWKGWPESEWFAPPKGPGRPGSNGRLPKGVGGRPSKGYRHRLG